MEQIDWNTHHEGAFTTEIVGCEPYGMVCGDETLISATKKAYELAFHAKLSPIEILHLPDHLTIAEHPRAPRNVLRIAVRD